MNGWDLTRLPTLSAEDLEASSLEETSKYIQRIASVGFLARTPEVVNKVLDVLGLEPLAEDVNLDDVLTSNISRAGDGMQTPNAGTSTDSSNIASGDNNLDNTA